MRQVNHSKRNKACYERKTDRHTYFVAMVMPYIKLVHSLWRHIEKILFALTMLNQPILSHLRSKVQSLHWRIHGKCSLTIYSTNFNEIKRLEASQWTQILICHHIAEVKRVDFILTLRRPGFFHPWSWGRPAWIMRTRVRTPHHRCDAQNFVADFQNWICDPAAALALWSCILYLIVVNVRSRLWLHWRGVRR